MRNAQEAPQDQLLTGSIRPFLTQLHPAHDYFIGQDTGIYWHFVNSQNVKVKSPDWYYVPGVPQLLDGQVRRSYVLFREMRVPHVVLEYASDDGAEERDRTPEEGKFWVYEQGIRANYYGIFLPGQGQLEVYQNVGGRFQRMTPNQAGRYPLFPLLLELGVWQGSYDELDAFWLRWWDTKGNLLLTPEELAERERVEKEAAQRHAEEAQRQAETAQRQAADAQRDAERERLKNERLAARLRELGIDPEQQ
jgi:Uma2 family endonuclease